MLSIPHLIIIFVVALVVFGPEKLPELARTLGKVMGEFRRATGELRGTFEDHLRDLEREAEQRKIGGATPAVKPAEGTVAATASNLPATDAPASPESAESTEGSSAGTASAAAVPAVPAAPSQSSEQTSETPTDGGARPA
jgi:TatA/E family protein of Tat protein translocase